MVTSTMVRPRYAWVPPRVRSLGPDCIAFWRDAGGDLFEWQEYVVDGMLGLDGEDKCASTNDGLCVARQNGKGVVLQAIEVFFAFELDYPVVMHTAHLFGTSQEHQLRLTAFIQDCPHLHKQVKDKGGYMFANGRESINLKSGSRILFKARTMGGGARGYSGDLLVWDEAMKLPTAVVGAQKPTLRASQATFGPKVIYAGSAVDQEEHEHGVPFALIRERGLERSPRLSYYEWSAPFDHPDEMTIEILRDRSWWPLANPSLPEGLISEDYMADEIDTLPLRSSAVELACVGDWPRTDLALGNVISPEAWAALVDAQSAIIGDYFFAFDVTPDRSRASIAVSGRRGDGNFHSELIDRRGGTGWVAARLAELDAKYKPEAILCDSLGPAASLIHELEPYGVTVQTLDTQEYAQACALFYDNVERKTLRHIGQPEFVAAVRGAVKRPLSDSFAWSRKNSSVDITPLVAATIALWGAAQYQGGGLVY